VTEPTEPKPPKPPRTRAGRDLAERGKARQIWCAYEPDGSEFVLFGAELAALRYATEHHMSCRAVRFGVPLREQVKGPDD
jgi:hypothetical protein